MSESTATSPSITGILAIERGKRFEDRPAELAGPVEALAGEERDLAARDMRLDAVAVELHLVQPFLAATAGSIAGVAKLWLDEIGHGGNGPSCLSPDLLKHGLSSSPRLGVPGASSPPRPRRSSGPTSPSVALLPGCPHPAAQKASSDLISSQLSRFSPGLGFSRTRCQAPLSLCPRSSKRI